MSNQQIYVLLATCGLVALVLAVAVSWRIKHQRFTVDEMNFDERAQKRRY